MDENGVRRIVNSWHDRALQEDEHVARFVFLWFCFNAWLSYESSEDTDGAMIRWLACQHVEISPLRAAFTQSMQSRRFVSDVRKLADLSPVASNGRRSRPHKISSPEDFPNIIWCIYQVRCNLFHGTKHPEDPRDRELVRTCSQIMETWIGCLVSSWY
jgi:hypothetical protein